MGRKVINLKSTANKTAGLKKKGKAPVGSKGSGLKAKPVTRSEKPKAKMTSVAAKVIDPGPPTRAPVRKVMRDGKSVIVEPNTAPATLTTSQPEASQVIVTTPEVVPVFPKGKMPLPTIVTNIPLTIETNGHKPSALESIPATPKFSWTGIPKYIPAQIRFILTEASRECEAASTWPFPFAKFIAGLPKEICGVEFALLVLALDREVSTLPELCRLTPERVESLISSGRTSLVHSFSTLCPEICRRWRVHMTGAGREPEGLVEQHLVMKVNRDFQIMLCAIIVQALSAQESAQVGTLASSGR